MGGRYGKYGEVKRFERLRRNRRNSLRGPGRPRIAKDHVGKSRPFKNNLHHLNVKD
jgi:hypothetical protein